MQLPFLLTPPRKAKMIMLADQIRNKGSEM